MPQSPSWIDPDAFAANLGEPTSPESEGTEWPSSGLAGSRVEGTAEQEQDTSVEVAATVDPTVDPATETEAPARRPPPILHPQRTEAQLSGLPIAALQSLELRARLFQRWMRTLVGDRPFFVTDAEGLVLVAERVQADRAVAAPVLERAIRLLRPFIGSARARSAHVELEDGQLLQMVWHSTPRGRVGLGVFGDPVLDAARVDWVARALERVFAKDAVE